MPNPDSVIRPITLISNGRSGTSLAMHILRDHPDIFTCGETQTIIFGVWQSMERAKGVIRPDPDLGPKADHRERCAKAVRAVFCTTFPDDGPRWMHKPINVPWVMRQGGRDGTGLNPPVEWYWEVMHHSFPESRNITILRHPYDVVLSAAEYWGATHARAWRSVVNMASIIGHPDSTIDFALSHRRLVEDPDPEVARLLDHLDLAPHPSCFEAPDRIYVPRRRENRIPKQEEPDLVKRRFSRRGDWSSLDMSSFTTKDRDTLVSMWARFGETLDF